MYFLSCSNYTLCIKVAANVSVAFGYPLEDVALNTHSTYGILQNTTWYLCTVARQQKSTPAPSSKHDIYNSQQDTSANATTIITGFNTVDWVFFIC